MLPPIPQGLIPVTVQQDPPKPRPATPPVAPTQAGAGSDGVALRQERDEESWLEEEYRRRQRRQGGARRTRGATRGTRRRLTRRGRAPRRTSCRARDN